MKKKKQFKNISNDDLDVIAEKIKDGITSGELYSDGWCVDWELIITERKEK